ncbi:MAG: pentapeptide repeat-containing protein [Streptosporangiaceae bacterium]
MASQKYVDWPTCSEAECIGVRLDTGTCLAHADDQARRAALEQVTQTGKVDARGVTISPELLADILAATPTGDDGHLVLISALFARATFTGDASFTRATFEGGAEFSGATFQGAAEFSGATFQGAAEFSDAIFKRLVSFEGTTFTGIARFILATFQGIAGFRGVTFMNIAQFDVATFEREQRFGPMLAYEKLFFNNVQFRGLVVLEASAPFFSCRWTRFPAGVQLQLRRARVVLEDTDLSVPSLVTGIPRLSDDKLAEADERQYGDGQTGQPRIISLRRAKVSALGLSNVSLAECRFAGAHNLDLMRLDGDITFALSPARAGWERRQVIAEETQWRAQSSRPGRWTAPPWPEWADDEFDVIGDEPAPLDPGTVAGIYRALRKGREDARDQPGAADFYYGEMEMRRHTTGPASERETGSRGRADRVILTLYWLASGYGLRAWRSFTALAALAVVITALMTGWGLAASAAPQTLRGTSSAGRISGTLTTTTPKLPPAGQRWTSERVRTSAEVALDAFVFRTTDLPLTPAGAWIEDLARILGPLLLALGLLAVRNRVKR